jgi:hypothetical protein
MDLAFEDTRIAHHIAGAETPLRARNHPLLPVLEEYRRAGRFPRNRTSREWTPVFVDEGGTRCAMAHLLEHVGAHDFVRRVASMHNLARIHDLRADRELLHWLLVLGITLEEAARIQPAYCMLPSDCYCSSPEDLLGVVEGAVSRGDTGALILTIDVIHRGTGFAVGDKVQLAAELTERTTLATVHGRDVITFALPLPRDRVRFTECSQVLDGLPLLTREETIAAPGATCATDLVSRDRRFGERVCKGGLVPSDSGPDSGNEVQAPTHYGGCAVGHLDPSGSLVAALTVSLLAAGRLRRCAKRCSS